LTITEENEDELEQLRRDDDAEQHEKRSDRLVRLHDVPSSTVSLHDDDDRADLLENENASATTATIANLSLMNFEQDLHDDIERLSTIYESPSPPPRIDDDDDDDDDNDTYDKLIVYDIANGSATSKVCRTRRVIVVVRHRFCTCHRIV
jgi:hypothetical protein